MNDMVISKYIPLKVEEVIAEIKLRQGLPWNNGRINDYSDFSLLQKLFEYMNNGAPKDKYFYQGNIYRIHSSYAKLIEQVDHRSEHIVSQCSDGSCSVLPITEYSDNLVSFSKNRDFTRPCYNKIYPTESAIMFYCCTGTMFGLDVNAFLQKYGAPNERYIDEQEVLFPLNKKCIVKEYKCTPNQFNYYLRKHE